MTRKHTSNCTYSTTITSPQWAATPDSRDLNTKRALPLDFFKVQAPKQRPPKKGSKRQDEERLKHQIGSCTPRGNTPVSSSASRSVCRRRLDVPSGADDRLVPSWGQSGRFTAFTGGSGMLFVGMRKADRDSKAAVSDRPRGPERVRIHDLYVRDWS